MASAVIWAACMRHLERDVVLLLAGRWWLWPLLARRAVGLLVLLRGPLVSLLRPAPMGGLCVIILRRHPGHCSQGIPTQIGHGRPDPLRAGVLGFCIQHIGHELA